MAESLPQIYLVAGATRGIGLALVEDIASKDSTAIIYAGARNPSSPGASKLIDLASKYSRRVEVVKYVAGDKEGNEEIARAIKEKHGRVDTVIANAGIANMGKIHETPIHEFQEHFSVNVVGPIILFQSIRNLLKASALPCFVPISSGVGSMELIPTMPIDGGPYGTSKAALNWVTRKIHYENDWLVTFPLCPGSVDTDMAQHAVSTDKSGHAESIKDIWRPANVAASMLVDIIIGSTREKDGGVFNNVEGKRHPW